MFADDTKIWRGIYTVEDQESLQDDLDKLMSWSEEWLLKFNPEKCKLMCIGHGLQTEYEMTENGKSHSLESMTNMHQFTLFRIELSSHSSDQDISLSRSSCRLSWSSTV